MKERFERLGAARALFIWPRGVARSLAFLFCATARPLWGIISFPWPSRARLGNLKGIIVGRKKIRAFDGRKEGRGGRRARQRYRARLPACHCSSPSARSRIIPSECIIYIYIYISSLRHSYCTTVKSSISRIRVLSVSIDIKRDIRRLEARAADAR